MMQLCKRVGTSAVMVGLLASGMVVSGASAAMANGATTATSIAAAPCGLSYQVEGLPAGPLKIVYYKIRNCHSYTVRRKLELAGTTDEPCLTIHAGATVSRTRIIAGWAAVVGIKPC